MCYLRVAAEETPVDVCTVPDVRVVVLGGSGLENLLNELLGLRLVRLLEEEFDNGGKNLELGLETLCQRGWGERIRCFCCLPG